MRFHGRQYFTRAWIKWSPFCRQHFQVFVFNEHVWVWSEKSYSVRLVNNLPALVWVVTWCLTDDKSTLVLVMAWCHQTAGHYLNQCWSSSVSTYWWLSARLQYLQCVSNRDTAVLYQTFDMVSPGANMLKLCPWRSNHSWWCHSMEILPALLVPTEDDHSPHKGPIMWSFSVFFVVIPNKLLNKQLGCWSFEMPWCSCNITIMSFMIVIISLGYGIVSIWNQVIILTSADSSKISSNGHILSWP